MENEENKTHSKPFSDDIYHSASEEIQSELSDGNIQEAESCLRQGLSLNFEEARALLGRLEYKRGNLSGALLIFEGIDFHTAIQRQISLVNRKTRRLGLHRSISRHVVSLLHEAIYLKAETLHKLGRLTEAASECRNVIDSIEKLFLPKAKLDTKLYETISHALESLPEILKEAGEYHEAVIAYRRALLNQWNLETDFYVRIQKDFAVFLLYSGVENNLEEAILLLMDLIKIFNLGKAKWDLSVFEHLTFALSLCNQTSVLAKQLEEMIPGTVFSRVEIWKKLALCYSAAGESKVAINLLRKCLHKHEEPNDVMTLLLAAKLCSEDRASSSIKKASINFEPTLNEDINIAKEGVSYAKRALSLISNSINQDLKGVGLRMLGVCLRNQAKVVSISDFERFCLKSEALKALNEALSYEKKNSDLIFELSVMYAEERNLEVALSYVKEFIDLTGGSVVKGWRLFVLVLLGQKRFREAENVINCGLEESLGLDREEFLRLKAKISVCQLNYVEAFEIYSLLLKVGESRKKCSTSVSQKEEEEAEFEVWHGLANLYLTFKQFKDVEDCLTKASKLKQYSPETKYTEGQMWLKRNQYKQALAAFLDGKSLDESFVNCKVAIGALLTERGKDHKPTLPVARCLLSDAIRIDSTNQKAWYYLGMVYKLQGCLDDAIDCFQAAFMLEESDPIENFSTVL